MEKFMCKRKIDPIGIEIGIPVWLITNIFLVSWNSIWRMHYGERKVGKLFDFDENWFQIFKTHDGGIKIKKYPILMKVGTVYGGFDDAYYEFNDESLKLKMADWDNP